MFFVFANFYCKFLKNYFNNFFIKKRVLIFLEGQKKEIQTGACISSGC